MCRRIKVSIDDRKITRVLVWLTYCVLKNLSGVTGPMVSECPCNLQYSARDKETDRGRPACLGRCQATLGPVFSHWAPFPKYVPPLWLLFLLSVCWLTQAIILTSGLHPDSLRHLMALILPLEASPPELCASALYSCWALFGSLLLFSLFFFHAPYIVFIQPASMGNTVAPLIDERCCYEA